MMQKMNMQGKMVPPEMLELPGVVSPFPGGAVAPGGVGPFWLWMELQSFAKTNGVSWPKTGRQ